MNQYCIQLINPNTSQSMTGNMASAARQVASPNTRILAVNPQSGVGSIEGHFDEAIATIGVLQQINQERQRGVDGHIIACFGDPGLLAARELSGGPVLGIAEAAMHLATMVATRFTIVTTLPRTVIIARHLLQQYGFTEHCAAIRTIDLPVLSLEESSLLAGEKIREQCLQAMQHDNSGAIVLGCGGMAGLADALTVELGIPVIDGVTAAVKLMESLLSLRLTTSKRGDLAYPIAKPLSGIFEDLSPV